MYHLGLCWVFIAAHERLIAVASLVEEKPILL